MEKTSKPIVTGVLDIVAGILGLIWAISLFIGFGVTGGIIDILGIGHIPEFLPGLILGMAIPALIIAILALIGGVFALQRKWWGWALTGSIFAILAFLPLGIAAVILVAQSKDEFA